MLNNYLCPTINNDRDKEMCLECKDKLELLIEQYELDIENISLEDIMKLDLEADGDLSK